MTEAASTPAPAVESAPATEAAIEAPASAEPVESPADATVREETQEAAVEALNAEEMAQLEALLPRFKKKLKVDDTEMELSFEELLTTAQKGFGADKRFEEAAEMRKIADSQAQQFENFLQALRENPSAVLSKPEMMGEKYRAHMEETLLGILQEEAMDPAEREQAQKLKEYEEMKKWKEEQERSNEQSRVQALQDKYAQELDMKFTSALETSGLPKTPKTIARMAQLMQSALEKGVDAEPADLIPIMQDEYREEISSYLGGIPEDALLEHLGDGVASKLRKLDLSRIKTPTTRTGAQTNDTPAPKKKSSKMSMAEFSERARRIAEGIG